MPGPIVQHPIAPGAGLNVYSLTQYVGGHRDLVAGGVTGCAAEIGRLKLMRSGFGRNWSRTRRG